MSGLAWRLIDEARAALDRMPNAILHKPAKGSLGSYPFLNAPRRYVLTLVPLPGVDAIRALRRILKRVLRQHGMRCVDIGG